MKDLGQSIIYQVYPKSFYDSNGDGIGDIRGITEKLDYIQSLGADYIWSTPFFTSPLNDNGYDVEDYRGLHPAFGTMEDVEELIREADRRGIGIMLDMVFNHTSTRHEWFQRALNGEQEYQEYYIFHEGDPDTPPTNWESKFGGNAWEYVPCLGKWYLHLFDRTQADLNWDNPKVREELKDVIRFWKEKGVRGFRFDVVNLISKPALFENDELGDGRRFYTDGPHVHEYLRELAVDTGITDMVTVGEMSSTSLENCIRYTKPEEQELSMVFNFHHLKVDYKDGNKWELQNADLRKLKDLLTQWQLGMQKAGGWNAVFWCNHDQPRAVSRFGDDVRYWKQSAKMLAAAIHLLRGTPYIFQGEELGMTNAGYTDISQYRDVESLNYYEIMLAHGKTKEEALRVLGARSRDNGRTPMQWTAGRYAGFSRQEPWIRIPDDHSRINVESEESDPDSILNFYKELVRLRKQEPAISRGGIGFLHDEKEEVFAYRRFLDGTEIRVFNNLTEREIRLKSALLDPAYEKVIGNYEREQREGSTLVLRAYETVAYRNR